METTILIFNWLIYGGLFFAFFIKTTDKKERGFFRKSAYIILTFFSLFMSVFCFKTAFGFQKNNFNPSFLETIFCGLVLFLMITKVREDEFFNKIKKKP